MARCSCGGSGGCSCRLVAGPGIIISGSGAPTDPFIITSENTSFANTFQVLDTSTVSLDLTGAGTEVDPFVLKATSALTLEQLTNFDDPSGPAVGEVLVYNGLAWEAAAPPTQAVGEVNAAGGISGDGTFGDPLVIAVSDDATDTVTGLATYIDTAGELRVVPPVSVDTSWDAISGKPSSFPTTWTDVASKPSSFPPVIGTTSTTAWAGNRLPTWSEVASKPNLVEWVPGSVVRLHKSGSELYFDTGTWTRLLDIDDGTALQASINTLSAFKANAVDDPNQAVYAKGTPQAHGTSVNGAGPYYSVWVCGSDTGYRFARNTSSRRFKEDITPHAIDTAAVLSLQPVTYDRVGGPVEREYGLIAEDVYDAGLTEIVTWFREEGSSHSEIDGLRYDLLAVALLEVVKEQHGAIADLTERVALLEEVA